LWCSAWQATAPIACQAGCATQPVDNVWLLLSTPWTHVAVDPTHFGIHS
jgi:hypothetical protein